MSLPRAPSVEDHGLRIDIPPQVRAATAPDADVAAVDLVLGAGYRIESADGERLEVEAKVEVRDAASVSLTLCRSPGSDEQTTVSWHRNEQTAPARPHRLKPIPRSRPRQARRPADPSVGRPARADGRSGPFRDGSVREPARGADRTHLPHPIKRHRSGTARYRQQPQPAPHAPSGDAPRSVEQFSQKNRVQRRRSTLALSVTTSRDKPACAVARALPG